MRGPGFGRRAQEQTRYRLLSRDSRHDHRSERSVNEQQLFYRSPRFGATFTTPERRRLCCLGNSPGEIPPAVLVVGPYGRDHHCGLMVRLGSWSCENVYTARVIFVRSTRSRRSQHVRFAPIASEPSHRRDWCHFSETLRARGHGRWAAKCHQNRTSCAAINRSSLLARPQELPIQKRTNLLYRPMPLRQNACI